MRACRERKIAVYAYYCTSWDHHLAQTQPEWRMLKRNGTNYLPAPDRTPGWTALCLGNPQFVDLMVEHTREFVSRYELDGAWFDMSEPIAPECFCAECHASCARAARTRGRRRAARISARGVPRVSPADAAGRPRNASALSDRFQRHRARADRRPRGDARQHRNRGAAHRRRWGYFYFPTLVRYFRNFGVTTYGQTGRFKSAWADFGA